MKEIKAFIQPFMLGKVTKALEEIPEFPGMSVSDVKGFGRGKLVKRVRIVEFVPKVKIEIIAKDEMVDRIVETIQKYAHTGNMGDGKIFVSNADYLAKAVFEKAPAKIKIQMVLRNDRWQIVGFLVRLEV